MFDNPRRLRRPEERVGNVTNADLPPPASSDDEAILIERIRANDNAAFEHVLDLYHSAMLRVAMNYVRSIEEAEEIIQETWIAVLSGIQRFQRRSSFKTWLFRILVNRARTRGTRESRTASVAPGDPALELPSGNLNPEQEVLDGELRNIVEHAVATLPRTQRLVITLRDIEGWDADEVCAALKLTPANQRVLLHRARMKVRELVMPYVELEVV
jgi:RNA polymerase sigma-70 factor, ECF subfamily